MNLRHGFKRITFVLSLLVAIIAAVLVFVSIFETWDYERNEYYKNKEDYEDIANFWLVWDANGWTAEKHEIVRYIWNSRTQYRGAGFNFGDKEVYLSFYQVFPGISEEMLNLPNSQLEYAAQVAKREALQNAQGTMKLYEWWGKKKTFEVILLGILAALVGAGLGYFGTWGVVWFGGIAIYKFTRWLIRGFREDEKFSTISEQIAERHNKNGVTLTDPRTGKDLFAGMTDEQREKYRQFKIKTSRMKQEKKENGE